MNKSIIRNAVNLAISSHTAFYAYRLPDDCEIHFAAQRTPGYQSPTGLKIVPFDISGKLPTVRIYDELSAAELLKMNPTSPVNPSEELGYDNVTTSKQTYLEAAESCLKLLKTHTLEKIVLSKVITGDASHFDWGTLYETLTEMYPSAFTFIVQTPQTGIWMGASPERLGIYDGSTFQTMALAGTRKAGTVTPWGSKEIEEQEIVVRYIAKAFENAGVPFTLSEKTTHKAGSIEHLCNHFTAHISSLSEVERLVGWLHPTPALSGLPKEDAIRAINQIERHERAYYGGYLGPFSEKSFNYFVNLRSLSSSNRKFTIYCGGGLTAESLPESEWEETEAKSQTMLSLLNHP